MPKLILFVACESVSYDSSTSAASLIGVFQGFTLTVAKELPEGDVPVPLSARPVSSLEHAAMSLPLRWAVFALWRQVPEDADTEFTQFCELLSPSGKKAVGFNPMDFRMTRSFQRNTMNVSNFPVSEEGDYILRLMLNKKKQQRRSKTNGRIPDFRFIYHSRRSAIMKRSDMREGRSAFTHFRDAMKTIVSVPKPKQTKSPKRKKPATHKG